MEYKLFNDEDQTVQRINFLRNIEQEHFANKWQLERAKIAKEDTTAIEAHLVNLEEQQKVLIGLIGEDRLKTS